jgi:hypothetical protein
MPGKVPLFKEEEAVRDDGGRDFAVFSLERREL